MKEIPSKQDHIDVPLFCQAHDFVEALPAVVAPNVVSLVVTDMTVGSHQDPNSIRCCGMLVVIDIRLDTSRELRTCWSWHLVDEDALLVDRMQGISCNAWIYACRQ